jgi:formate dehydrogenase major subunit
MPVWPPWLAEAQGEPLLGIGQGLSLEGRVSNSHRATVSSAGGKIEMVAIVTPEFKPFTLNGKTVHEVEGLKTT